MVKMLADETPRSGGKTTRFAQSEIASTHRRATAKATKPRSTVAVSQYPRPQVTLDTHIGNHEDVQQQTHQERDAVDERLHRWIEIGSVGGRKTPELLNEIYTLFLLYQRQRAAGLRWQSDASRGRKRLSDVLRSKLEQGPLDRRRSAFVRRAKDHHHVRKVNCLPPWTRPHGAECHIDEHDPSID